MNFNDSKEAIYLQIIDKIKADIISGRLSPDEKLPAVREFALDLKVNPNTVQRSYQELERDKLIVTQRGIGSFVTSETALISELRKKTAEKQIRNFLFKMKRLGFNRKEILQFLNSLEEENE